MQPSYQHFDVVAVVSFAVQFKCVRIWSTIIAFHVSI